MSGYAEKKRRRRSPAIERILKQIAALEARLKPLEALLGTLDNPVGGAAAEELLKKLEAEKK